MKLTVKTIEGGSAGEIDLADAVFAVPVRKDILHRCVVWQLSRRQIDARYWLVELIDRTVEADIGRARTDFVANASHELRTPLASLLGFVETLQTLPVERPSDIKFFAPN